MLIILRESPQRNIRSIQLLHVLLSILYQCALIQYIYAGFNYLILSTSRENNKTDTDMTYPVNIQSCLNYVRAFSKCVTYKGVACA